MTAILARRPLSTRRRDCLRLLAIAAWLIVASVAWHAARPQIRRACARSSVGLFARNFLLRTVISDLHAEIPFAQQSYYSPDTHSA
jgi:hypothetical protein